jgi:hypothetical protein
MDKATKMTAKFAGKPLSLYGMKPEDAFYAKR